MWSNEEIEVLQAYAVRVCDRCLTALCQLALTGKHDQILYGLDELFVTRLDQEAAMAVCQRTLDKLWRARRKNIVLSMMKLDSN